MNAFNQLSSRKNAGKGRRWWLIPAAAYASKLTVASRPRPVALWTIARRQRAMASPLKKVSAPPGAKQDHPEHAAHRAAREAPWRTVIHRGGAFLRKIEPYGQALLLLVLRLLYGGLLVQTGWGKLTHLAGTAEFFAGIGLPAANVMVVLVGSIELAGGMLLVLGAGTRIAALALATIMVGALLTAHAAEAWQSITAFTEQAPYPFLLAALLVLAFGAGRYSIDGWLIHRATARSKVEANRIEANTG